MDDILEFILAIISVTIYGTEDKPRHPFWRNSIRAIAFIGVFVSAASFLNMFGDYEFPFLIISIWALCSLIVLSAEYYAGSKAVGLAALGAFLLWIVIVFTTQFVTP